jgi:hypothetical protein
MQDQRNDYTVDEETGCWVWQGPRWGKYGRAWREGRNFMSHRWYWERRHGPVPEGLELDHLCRNTLCVNPDHLEAVTRETNIRRSRVAKLTVGQILEIRAQSRTPGSVLAKRYGVSRQMIGRIRRRQNWIDIAGVDAYEPRCPLGEPPKLRRREDLTEQEVAEIKAAPRHYGSGRELAHRYGVSDAIINRVRGRQP